MRLTSTALFGALALAGGWQSAHAARSYDACTGYVDTLPATISTPGHWCLRKDLSTGITQGAAITVASNNVTLDCNDFKLVGLTAGANTLAYGIVASGRANTTVRNCVVRGFLVGLQLSGSGHVVEDNLLDANTDHGIWVFGDDALIRRNRILDTGGAERSATAIETSGAADILDNTIAGVAPVSSSAGARGVKALKADGSTIAGNRISGVMTAFQGGTTAGAIGISVLRWDAVSFTYDSVTWEQARQRCQAEGGDLAVVNNADEADLYGTQASVGELWVGGSDAAQEGTWRWIDGQPWSSFPRWGAGQPDNAGGNQDYLAIKTDGTWADENGSSLKGYICEFDEHRAPVVVRGNTVIGTQAAYSTGISGSCAARDNVISGWEKGMSTFCSNFGGNQILP